MYPLRGTSKIAVAGIYTLTKCDVRTPEARRMQDDIAAAAREDWRLYRTLLASFNRRFGIWQSAPIHNLVVNDGLNVLARILANDSTYTGVINYCALGTGTTAVAAGDTTLGTEVFRKAVTSQTFSANEAFISTFFTAADDDDTYNEVGHFIDGTGDADSGQLFSRIEEADTAELPVTKSNTETLTVDYKVTLTASS
jgi:hypothetical protein